MTDSIYEGPPPSRVLALLKEPERSSLFMLGEGLVHAYAPSEVACSAPYVELGTELWKALEFELYDLLCDSKSKTPKDWTNYLMEGDARDLAIALVTLMVAQFEATIAIAVPASALIMRKRLNALCSNKRRKRPARSVKTILAHWKRNWSRHRR